MINDKLKCKGGGGLIKPRQRKVEDFIHLFTPLSTQQPFIEH